MARASSTILLVLVSIFLFAATSSGQSPNSSRRPAGEYQDFQIESSRTSQSVLDLPAGEAGSAKILPADGQSSVLDVDVEADSKNALAEFDRSAQLAQYQSQSPGFTPRMIKTPTERRHLRTVPIIQRPYRPGHFYGNTVRRIYYGRPSGSFLGRRR